MKQKIQQDLKEALLKKDTLATGTLRMLLAALVNKEKERGTPVTEEEAQNVLLAEAKKRKEAAEAFAKGGRHEAAAKERKELAILQRYLPAQLTQEEIRKLAKEAIAKTHAATAKDMGKVMAALMPELKGRADGSLVNSVVREFLQE